MNSDHYECVVVGSGIIGSWTAYQALKKGGRTLLVEQFSLLNSRGSSQGASRIVRHAYSDAAQTRLMPDNYRQWRELERLSGNKLIREVGLLCMGPANCAKEVQMTEKSLEQVASTASWEMLDARGLHNKYPEVRYDSSYTACNELAPAGIMFADLALQSIQGQFQRRGGEMKSNMKLINIKPGPRVRLLFKCGSGEIREITADKVALCPGPWASKVLSLIDLKLPLEPIRVPVFYFKTKPGQKSLPCPFMDYKRVMNGMTHMYGLPCYEYPDLVKIGLHGGTNVDPDMRDLDADTSTFEKYVNNYVAEHFPTLEPKPVIRETCMYTVTPDERYILDRHPTYANITFAVGFSGTGFKMGPVVGEELVKLMWGEKTRPEMQEFTLNRFTKSKM